MTLQPSTFITMDNTIPRIFSPNKSHWIYQRFGKENTNPSVAHIYAEMGLLGHDGWDWMVSCKNSTAITGGQCEPLYCNVDGYSTITYIQKDVKYGFGIMALDQNNNYKHLWWHFDSINPQLKVGSRLEAGVFLGIAGNTGNSTGAHCHQALYSYEAGDNGYKGAIDMTPFYTPIFILDHLLTMQKTIGVIEQFKSLIPNFQEIINKIKKGFSR